jgi:hypothetical protein
MKRLQQTETEVETEITIPDKTMLHEVKEHQMKGAIDDN